MNEVTQWETITSVEKISEAYLVPVLESMLVQFPFIIRGFHSDNGAEFVNHIVARLPKQTSDPFHKIKAQAYRR
ncbi:MAG: hypothetical protein AUK00_01500 [Dehalococcoidia bacterium CG2_30_46_9]|nr:MAG: hypothetical protein AUK00_01500 [Dehalococcoidia bacterium CG2_30_46_9]